jgi:putative endonuclease
MAMHYVYILESLTVPGHFYIGYTDNLRGRVRKHHADVSAHAVKYRPWKRKTLIALDAKAKALRFERYLKSGSCRTFCKKTFRLMLRFRPGSAGLQRGTARYLQPAPGLINPKGRKRRA